MAFTDTTTERRARQNDKMPALLPSIAAVRLPGFVHHNGYSAFVTDVVQDARHSKTTVLSLTQRAFSDRSLTDRRFVPHNVTFNVGRVVPASRLMRHHCVVLPSRSFDGNTVDKVETLLCPGSNHATRGSLEGLRRRPMPAVPESAGPSWRCSLVIGNVWRLPPQLAEILLHDLVRLRLTHVYLGLSSEDALLSARALGARLWRLPGLDGERVSAHPTVGMLQRRVGSEDGKDIAKLHFYQAALAHARASGDDCLAATDVDEIFIPRERPTMTLDEMLRRAVAATASLRPPDSPPPCTFVFTPSVLPIPASPNSSADQPLGRRFQLRSCDADGASPGYFKSIASVRRALYMDLHYH
eukprot:3631689-Prymnesium_polylepis.1